MTLTTEAAAAQSSVWSVPLSVFPCTQPAARQEEGIARDCLAPGRGGPPTGARLRHASPCGDEKLGFIYDRRE